MIYIITTHGRTGSHILVEMLSSESMKPEGLCNAISGFDPRRGRKLLKYKDQYNIVIHTHDNKFVEHNNIDPQEVVLIVSNRYNIFDSLMSLCIGQKTKEWQFYTSKKIEPFHVPSDQLLLLKKSYNNYYSGIDRTLPYNKIIDIYYEDIIKYGTSYVAELLGVKDDLSRKSQIRNKSPYSYKDLIINWEELLILFHRK